MTDILDWINKYQVVIATALAVLGLVYSYYRTSLLPDLKEKLADTTHRTRIIQATNNRNSNAYFDALHHMIHWADDFYGPAKFGQRAIARCLQLAIFYPLIAALLGWVIINTHSPGGLQLFHDLPDVWSRLWRAFLLITAIGALARLMQNSNAFIAKTNILLGKISPSLTRADALLSKASALVSFVVFVVVAVVVILAGVLAGVGAVVIVVVLAGVLAGAVAHAVAVAVAGFIAIVIAIVITGVGVVIGAIGDIETGGLLLFFYLLLPLCNATADILSVAATRGFLGRVADKRHGLLAILALLLVDLVVGVICLVILLLLLTQILDLWALWLPTTVPLDWRAYWQVARLDPWQGIALWMMALTTLLPTLLHLLLGIGAIATHKFRLETGAIHQLETCNAKGNPSPPDCTDIAKRLIRADFYGYALAAVLLGVILYLLPPPALKIATDIAAWFAQFLTMPP